MTSGPFRQQSRVKSGDPDFTVKLASVDDLVQVHRDAVARGLRRRWSDEDALQRQVEPGTSAVLCPLFRNGGPEGSPESYRCWMWFVTTADRNPPAVSLIDVGKEMLSSLPEAATPGQLRHVVLVMMEGIAVGSRFEPIQ